MSSERKKDRKKGITKEQEKELIQRRKGDHVFGSPRGPNMGPAGEPTTRRKETKQERMKERHNTQKER